jgi:uncharacterized protein with HEPN domain
LQPVQKLNLSERDRIYLHHTIDAGNKILIFITHRTRADLDTNEILALAVVRLLEILGKAANNVSPATKAKYSHLADSDRQNQADFDINLDIIWRIISIDLPLLVTQLEKIWGGKSDN